jgi:hypothetical protein
MCSFNKSEATTAFAGKCLPFDNIGCIGEPQYYCQDKYMTQCSIGDPDNPANDCDIKRLFWNNNSVICNTHLNRCEITD